MIKTQGASSIISTGLSHLPDHPRLFLDTTRWKALSRFANEDPCGRALCEELRRRTERTLLEAPIACVKEGRRLLEPARRFQSRMSTLGMMFRLTGNDAFLHAAEREIGQVVELQDWNPSHFLDVAEMALGMALAYDWLHDGLPAELRDAMAKALVNKALRPAHDGPEPGQIWWWVDNANNWNQVCHGGLTIASLAIYEHAPELSQFTVDRALRMVPKAATAYAPDGVYPEGPMYWCYGTTFHVLLIDALEGALGDSFGLADHPGFLQSADYMLQTITPAGQVFCYADARPLRGASLATGNLGRELAKLKGGFNTTLFWFAARQGRRDLVRWEVESLLHNDLEALGVADRFLPWTLIWLQQLAGQTRQPAPKMAQHWHGRGTVPISVHRNSVNAPASIYLGCKGGSPGAPHGHMDGGSFFLEVGGIVWALDPGMQNYTDLEICGLNLWDFSRSGDRWSVFRLGPDGHNIPRFNGQPQNPGGQADLVSFRDSGAIPHSVFDLTSLYPGEVTFARRGVAIRDKNQVWIRDEWNASAITNRMTFQWLTCADVEIIPEGFLLHQDGKVLHVRVAGHQKIQIEIHTDDILRKAYDEPNPGLKRVDLVMDFAPGENSWLALSSALGEMPHTVPPALSEWSDKVGPS